jgi:hypothetical protein
MSETAEKSGSGSINYGGTVIGTLSRRDYFAGVALQGLLACTAELRIDGKPVERWPITMARFSFEMADAMIAESFQNTSSGSGTG